MQAEVLTRELRTIIQNVEIAARKKPFGGRRSRRQFGNCFQWERLVRHRILLLLAIISAAVHSGSANAFDTKDMIALQGVVHEICVQPDRKGTYIKYEGDLSAGATLRIAGISGTGKVTKEDWDGISQTLQSNTDPRQCGITLTGMLIKAMTPKDCTGKQITGYGREFDDARGSGWRGGGSGYSTANWCNDLINQLRGQNPNGVFGIVSQSEETKNTCAPFNCPQYLYHCTVHVKADPQCE